MDNLTGFKKRANKKCYCTSRPLLGRQIVVEIERLSCPSYSRPETHPSSPSQYRQTEEGMNPHAGVSSAIAGLKDYDACSYNISYTLSFDGSVSMEYQNAPVSSERAPSI